MDLYQEEILKHSRNPHNQRQIQFPSHQSEGYNRKCGDHIKVFLNIQDKKIQDIAFTSDACAIVTASASVMTTILKGQSVDSVSPWSGILDEIIAGKSIDIPKEARKLDIFKIISQFPSRMTCASLPWHTLLEAINSKTMDHRQ